MNNQFLFNTFNFSEEQPEPSTSTPRGHSTFRGRGRGGSPRRTIGRPTLVENNRTPGRKPPRSNQQKLELILTYINQQIRWSLGDFLFYLFDSTIESNSRSQAVSKFLSGQTAHLPLEIVQLIYESPYSYPKPDHVERNMMFSVTRPSSEISFARPAMSTWALEKVVQHAGKESSKLITPEAGLRVRATSRLHDENNTEAGESGTAPDNVTGGTGVAEQGNSETRDDTDPLVEENGDGDDEWKDMDNDSNGEGEGGGDGIEDGSLTTGNSVRDNSPTAAAKAKPKRRRLRRDPTVSWDAIGGFSLRKLEETLRKHAPVCWHIIMRFMLPTEKGLDQAIHRPKRIVSNCLQSSSPKIITHRFI